MQITAGESTIKQADRVLTVPRRANFGTNYRGKGRHNSVEATTSGWPMCMDMW